MDAQNETRPPEGTGPTEQKASQPSAPQDSPRSDGTLLAQALDLVHGDLLTFVVFPSSAAAEAVTLWIAATYCQDLWEHATRLVAKSPMKRCGKSRLFEIARELAYRSVGVGNISAFALAAEIADDPPTLFLDNQDAKRRINGDDASRDLWQIIELGFARGQPFRRHDWTSKKNVEIPTFAMVAINGIGEFPDTIEDRAVVIPMQRRAPNETVKPYRRRDAKDLHQTRTILEQALGASPLKQLDSYEPPEMPVDDRAADVWEPLITVADAAGGDWPGRARAACLALTNNDEDEFVLAVKLLADLREVWAADEDHLATVTILERLHALDESPWADYFGRPLNPRDLVKLLRPFDMKDQPKTVRIGERTAKGYSREKLHPVWARYLPPLTPPPRYPVTRVTDPQAHIDGRGLDDEEEGPASEPGAVYRKLGNTGNASNSGIPRHMAGLPDRRAS